jgi:hypothetical protein
VNDLTRIQGDKGFECDDDDGNELLQDAIEAYGGNVEPNMIIMVDDVEATKATLEEKWVLMSDDRAIGAYHDDDLNYLMDTGSTANICRSEAGMKNLVPSNDTIRVGSSKRMQAKKSGDLHLKVKGTNQRVKLSDTLLTPEFVKNIVSVKKLTEKGNVFMMKKVSAKLMNPQGDVIDLHIGQDGMAYLVAEPDSTVLKTTVLPYNVMTNQGKVYNGDQ